MPIHANQYADITNHEQLKDFKFGNAAPDTKKALRKAVCLLLC